MKKRYWLTLITLHAIAAMAPAVALAADVSVAAATWSSTGATGLIAGNYQGSPDDMMLGSSLTGNSTFGFVTTSGGVTGVSPLSLNDSEFGFNQTNGSKVVSSSFSALASDKLTLHFNYVTTDGRGYDDYAWARVVSTSTNQTAAWLFTARSANAPDGDGSGDYVPGKVLSEQVNFKDLDSHDPNRQLGAVLNDGNPVVGMPGGSNTNWAPLGLADNGINGSYGWCWDSGSGCGSTGWVKSEYTFANAGSYYLEFGVINWGDEIFDSALAFDFVGLQRSSFGNVAVLENAVAAPVPEPETWALMMAGVSLMGFVARRRRNRET